MPIDENVLHHAQLTPCLLCAQLRGGALEQNAEHLARYLAAICDAYDVKDEADMVKQIHMASAFLLSLDSLTDGQEGMNR